MADNAQRRPNIVFILPDQLRLDECSYAGGMNIETPHIDSIAAGGVSFTNSIATCPLCTPYRGMLMTGRYPTHTGIVANFVDVNAEQQGDCLAELFARNGYHTGYIGKWHLAAGRCGSGNPYYRYAEWVPPGPPRLGFQHWQAFNFHLDFDDYWYYGDERELRRSERYETDAQFDQALEYISERKGQERPFFLMLSPHPPHPPYRARTAPPGYLDEIPEEVTWRGNVPGENPRTTEEMRVYLAMVKNIDDNVGRLLEFLRAEQLAEETIVVFASDHGEMHGSHGRINKMVPYREAVSVPLVFHCPARLPQGRVVRELFTPLDYLTTLCGLAGIEAPTGRDGIDLSGHIVGSGGPTRDAVLMMSYTSHWNRFVSHTKEEADRAGLRWWPEWRGLFTGQFTYARWLDGHEELYDNVDDPLQINDLAHTRSHEVRREELRRRMGELLAEAHDTFPPGSEYAAWFDERRGLLRTALGPVPGRHFGPEYEL